MDNELFLQKCPYEINKEWGVLENPSVDSLLRNPEIMINPILSETKQKETKTYVKQYKETLLKFLNHRWYEISKLGGLFTNDEKICLASEIFPDKDGTYKWRVTKGYYYHGYLTNFIYTQYVGGQHYKLLYADRLGVDGLCRF